MTVNSIAGRYQFLDPGFCLSSAMVWIVSGNAVAVIVAVIVAVTVTLVVALLSVSVCVA